MISCGLPGVGVATVNAKTLAPRSAVPSAFPGTDPAAVYGLRLIRSELPKCRLPDDDAGKKGHHFRRF